MMDKQRELEKKILRGQQAKEALSFMDDFENNEAQKLWWSSVHCQSDAIERILGMAPLIGEFKSMLEAVVNDGLMAAKDLELLSDE